MPTTMNQAMFDPEMDSITQARLYAKSLRDSTQKNIDEGKNGRMVGPYWIANDDRNDLLKQGMAGGLEYAGGQAAANLGTQRQAAETEWFNKVANAPTTKQETRPQWTEAQMNFEPQTLEDTAPASSITETKPMTYDERVAQARQFAAGAPQHSQLAQAYKGQVLTNTLAGPEKLLEMEEKARLALEAKNAPFDLGPGHVRYGPGGQVIARGEPVKPDRLAPAVEEFNFAKTNGYKGSFEDWMKLKHPKAAGSDGGASGLGKVQLKGMTLDGKQVVFSPTTAKSYVLNEDGTHSAYTGEVVPFAQSAKPALAAEEMSRAVPKMDRVIESVKNNPEAFGVTPALASILPNALGSRITAASLTPEQLQTRNRVMREAAVLIHQIYGAALSRGEEARANTWAVSPTDDFDMTMSKLTSARAYATDLGTREKPLNPAAPAPALPAATAAAGGKPQVKSVADYNKLKSGTVYIDPNGVEKTKK